MTRQHDNSPPRSLNRHRNLASSDDQGLPPEIWAHIADYLQNDSASLSRHTRVCRQWQAIFERQLYRKVHVRSFCFKAEKGILSEQRFRWLTSGTNSRRRDYVRHVDYTIILPYWLRDYYSTKLVGYSEQNSVRLANNEAFKDAVWAIMDTLSEWGDDRRVTLRLHISWHDKGQEPQTEETSTYQWWKATLDGESVVRPYRVQFPDDGTLRLPEVSCVDQLISSAKIWPGAVLQCAQRCVALRELHLHLHERIRPDHTDFIFGHRHAIACGLTKLPPSIRVFQLGSLSNNSWSNVIPALNVLSKDGQDIFAVNLRNLSQNLRELELKETVIDWDFLFPLDDRDKPTALTLSLYWPYLEILKLECVPQSLPSGEWTCDFEPSAWVEEKVPDPMTAGMGIFLTEFMERGDSISRNIIHADKFHRLFISLGYAARRMPLLKFMKFSLELGDLVEFEFNSRDSPVIPYLISNGPSANFTMVWASYLGYRPDARVARA
ncbi:hypothetical protein BJY00DRAFT_316081 [Aspergillus carlsbadensis]|nr:hypothetical protein BJY00DRAFT_316081 [Aspergillus carlsbadensis]